MTQEDKELLLKDLCARLPYGVICKSKSYRNILFDSTHISLIESEEIKPYLHPMSSMTEDEKNELKEYLGAEEVDCTGFGYIEGGTLEDYVSSIPYTLCSYVINWLNANHFDYHGLISKGLALKAPEGMYNDI
jgi:hypothetical protein